MTMTTQSQKHIKDPFQNIVRHLFLPVVHLKMDLLCFLIMPVINKLNLIRVPNKVTTTTNKNVPYKNEKPLDTLTLAETTIAIQKITKDIFPTCHLIAQPNHANCIIWYILHKLGYDGAHCDKDHSCHWHATQKIVIKTITKL